MPNKRDDLFDDANGCLAIGEFEEAITGYRQCVELDPEFFDGWQALGMALMKVGTVMTIDQRQFIGWHPMVDRHINKVANLNLKEVNADILKKLKQ